MFTTVRPRDVTSKHSMPFTQVLMCPRPQLRRRVQTQQTCACRSLWWSGPGTLAELCRSALFPAPSLPTSSPEKEAEEHRVLHRDAASRSWLSVKRSLGGSPVSSQSEAEGTEDCHHVHQTSSPVYGDRQRCDLSSEPACPATS